jgi:HPt (histidine-containing phosphotransfer) domain-containing protein
MGQGKMQRAARAADPSVFDLDHFKRYTMDNRDLEIEIIGLFRSQLPSIVKQMRRAMDPYDWKLAAHTLKGSARAVGAVRIGELAASLEGLEEAGQDRREPVLRELEVCIDAFEHEALRLYA